MLKELLVAGKKVTIFYTNTQAKVLPLVILNTFNEEGEKVYQTCLNIGAREFILVAISNLDWNNDLTPWFATKINKNTNNFLGKADNYLNLLINEIIPKVTNYLKENLQITIKYIALAGYSLAGLFAIYAIYKTDSFSRIVSASGSFWYPEFIDFASKNKISLNINKIYLSLGDKESKTRNTLLATVENNTLSLEQIFKIKGIDTIYESNAGNHFKDATLRTAKGIKWILE